MTLDAFFAPYISLKVIICMSVYLLVCQLVYKSLERADLIIERVDKRLDSADLRYERAETRYLKSK